MEGVGRGRRRDHGQDGARERDLGRHPEAVEKRIGRPDLAPGIERELVLRDVPPSARDRFRGLNRGHHDPDDRDDPENADGGDDEDDPVGGALRHQRAPFVLWAMTGVETTRTAIRSTIVEAAPVAEIELHHRLPVHEEADRLGRAPRSAAGEHEHDVEGAKRAEKRQEDRDPGPRSDRGIMMWRIMASGLAPSI